MRILTGTPQAAGSGSRFSRVVLVGKPYVVRAIVVSNFVGDTVRYETEQAKIIVYDTPDARQHGCVIKTGYCRSLYHALEWTGEITITNGAIQGFVDFVSSAQVGLFVVVDD